MSELEKVIQDPNSLAFLIYKGVEGAINAAEEIKIGKNVGIHNKKYSNKFIEDTFELLVKRYTGGSIKRKIFFKALMTLSWDDVADLIYNSILPLGKKEDGSYKNTKDTLLDTLKKYLGE